MIWIMGIYTHCVMGIYTSSLTEQLIFWNCVLRKLQNHCLYLITVMWCARMRYTSLIPLSLWIIDALIGKTKWHNLHELWCLQKVYFFQSSNSFSVILYTPRNMHTIGTEQETSYCLNQRWSISLTHICGTKGRINQWQQKWWTWRIADSHDIHMDIERKFLSGSDG